MSEEIFGMAFGAERETLCQLTQIAPKNVTFECGGSEEPLRIRLYADGQFCLHDGTWCRDDPRFTKFEATLYRNYLYIDKYNVRDKGQNIGRRMHEKPAQAYGYFA